MNQLFIYLDQNKWIDLAKSILEEPSHEKFREVRDMIQYKVKSGEWIFPLSIIHHFETMSRMEESSRKKLASVMGQISNNYGILPYTHVEKQELYNAIYTLHKLPSIDIKNEVIKKDFARAVGLDGTNIEIIGTKNVVSKKKVEEIMEKAMKEHNLFLEFMSEESDREFITELTQDGIDAKDQYESGGCVVMEQKTGIRT